MGIENVLGWVLRTTGCIRCGGYGICCVLKAKPHDRVQHLVIVPLVLRVDSQEVFLILRMSYQLDVVSH